MKPGTRVGAVLSAKEGVIDLLGFGVFNGDEVPPADVNPEFRKMMGAENLPNPKIVLDNGDVVWGCECWWGPEDSVKAKLEGATIRTVKIADFRNGARKDQASGS